jgi:hypothetical protein
MTANRLELVGLSVLVLTLTTTVSLAQNTSNPLLSVARLPELLGKP